MEMARAYCINTCRGRNPPPGIKPSPYGGDSGPNPVVLQGCSPKGGPDCKTNGPNGGPSGNYQWACYNPDALNANHTAWDGHTGFSHMCRGNEEIKSIISMCSCKARGPCPPYGL